MSTFAEIHIAMTSDIPTSSPKGGSQRLLALDIMRGITIAGMILVNNPGSWGNIYEPLRHAEWNGLTPTDLVFPFFMFIMGISTYMSMRKYDFRLTCSSASKILRRTLVIYLIGIGIAWFSLTLKRTLSGEAFSEALFNFDRIRLLGVLPRLALCYGIGAILALLLKRRALVWTVVGTLVAYSILLVFGNGYDFSEHNVISIADRHFLGEDHMYTSHLGDISLKFDPEGLLSTIPSIAHMLIGYLCGGLVMTLQNNRDRIIKLFIVGVCLTFSGFLLNYGLPINKKIWSPTFVLTTCGMASSLLGLLIWIIDIKGWKKWSNFFEVFGINPLFLYCLSSVLSIIIGAVKIPFSNSEDGFITIKGLIYRECLVPLCCGDETFASLIFALLFVAVNWLVGLYLYKKRIYIKI